MDRTSRLLGALVLVAALGACGQGGDRSTPEPPAAATAEATLDEATPEYDEYVALGDSYTAAPFVPETALTGCLRSTGNYPHLVAAELEVPALEDRSCSGADTTHLLAPQPLLGGAAPPQLQAVDAGTDLVTLGMGGNDFSVFATLVGECVALRDDDPDGTPCADGLSRGAGGRDPLLSAMGRIRSRLVAATEEIQRRAPDARVLLVGYPQIVPESGTCPLLLPLADGDYPYVRMINERLAETIADAAQDAGVDHVDVWTASAGHDVCSRAPWIAGAESDPARALAFHPYAEHQRAVADLILDRL